MKIPQMSLLSSFIFSDFTLTLTLTLETPTNRAFQPYCEGVRVEKEKNY